MWLFVNCYFGKYSSITFIWSSDWSLSWYAIYVSHLLTFTITACDSIQQTDESNNRVWCGWSNVLKGLKIWTIFHETQLRNIASRSDLSSIHQWQCPQHICTHIKYVCIANNHRHSSESPIPCEGHSLMIRATWGPKCLGEDLAQ